MFVGAMTAIVTPFLRGHVDREKLQALVEWQIASGIDALVPCGTTGESPTLTAAEQAEVISCVVKTVAGRVPVIAGASSNSTQTAVALSRAAEAAGADGLLQVMPYYNRPTQEGLYQHILAVSQASRLPIVLYNVPGRTASDLQVDTVARLAEIPQVVAIKEATGTVQRTQQIIAKLGDRLVVLSGEDAINYPLYCVGARGCISVVSNIAPRMVAQLWDAFADGKQQLAQRLHQQLLPITEALFWESNPTPVKAALAMQGRIDPEIRLPLLPLSTHLRERLQSLASGLT